MNGDCKQSYDEKCPDHRFLRYNRECPDGWSGERQPHLTRLGRANRANPPSPIHPTESQHRNAFNDLMPAPLPSAAQYI
ncbi:hypothetical protein J1614_001039 [Plenodomus biglobosus]|nr:hypothetical protein J1614_001039 [Plenodomus biglobosus]